MGFRNKSALWRMTCLGVRIIAAGSIVIVDVVLVAVVIWCVGFSLMRVGWISSFSFPPTSTAVRPSSVERHKLALNGRFQGLEVLDCGGLTFDSFTSCRT
eukprot:scaffold328_cov130-Cylindrotheca_fusiformis.AAC.5